MKQREKKIKYYRNELDWKEHKGKQVLLKTQAQLMVEIRKDVYKIKINMV